MKLLLAVAIAAILFAVPSPSRAQETADKGSLDPVLAEMQAGHQDKAMEALDEAIKQQPKNADAYLLRGALRMSVDPPAALADFNKVIELKPDSGAAYNQRAMLRLMNQDIPGALKDLDAAIANKHATDGVYDLRAQLRWQLDDPKVRSRILNSR
jgi:tetratricopeptide (TPR) repeat protein